MKKYLSYLLVFSLCFFSFFSTGCGRSGGAFKFLGAIVAGTIALSSGGAAAPVFAANLRGATKEAISASKVTVKVYEVDPTKDKLEGTPKNEVGATFKDGKTLSFKTDETKKLEIGEYIFVASYKVNNIDINFLRGVLTINGNTDNLKFDITPETEVKTNVYKEWIKENPEVTTFANFEGNMKKAPQTTIKKIETQITQYEAKLAEWAAKDDSNKATEDVAKDIDVKDIAKEIPTETEVAPIVTNPIDTEFAKKVPTALKNYAWKDVTVADIDHLGFLQMYQKHNSNWYELKTEEIADYDSLGVPKISFMESEDEETGAKDYILDIHDYPKNFMQWLVGQAKNYVAIIPRHTLNNNNFVGYEEAFQTYINQNNIGYAGDLDLFIDTDNATLTDSILKVTIGQETTAENKTYELKIAKNGSIKYLYLKDKVSGDLAERIFIHDPSVR